MDDRQPDRWTPGFAQQVRRSLNCGECTADQIAAAEGLTIDQLHARLVEFPPPKLPVMTVQRQSEEQPGVALPSATRPRRPRAQRPPRHDVPAMHREYEAGATLEQVGAARGITRERVRQLFGAAGLATRDLRAYGELQRLRALQAAEPFREEIVLAWQGGASARLIANRIGLRTAAVQEIVDQHTTELDRRRHRANAMGSANEPIKATKERCVDCVCEATRLCGDVPTIAEYTELARQHPDWPAGITIAVTWGWSATLEAAGLVKRRGFSAPRADRVSPQRCWQALHSVAGEIGRIPTCQAYEAAARGRADLPSLAVVRRRLGGWRAILAAWPGPTAAESDPEHELAELAARFVRRAADELDRVPSLVQYDELAVRRAWMRGAFIARRFGWAATVTRAGFTPHRGRTAA